MSAASQKSSGRSSTGHAGPVSGAVGIIRTGGRHVKGTVLTSRRNAETCRYALSRAMIASAISDVPAALARSRSGRRS